MIQLPFPSFLPESNWKPKALSDLPDLSAAKEIYVDLETYDPNLEERGPGDLRKDGFVTGYTIGTGDEGSEIYLPIRHSSGNFDVDTVKRYLNDTLKYSHQPKIAANGSYDRGWLKREGIDCKGTWHDVQIAEALINEEKDTYRLDALALEYLGEGKEETLLNEANWYEDSTKKIMHLMEARHVGPYAEGDIRKTRGVFKAQQPKLKEQGLSDIFSIESRLSTVVFWMRQRGVRFDSARCETMARDYRKREDALYTKLRNEFFSGYSVSFLSGEDLGNVCRKLGIDYPITKAGNPSFTKSWLEVQEHPFLLGVQEWRLINTLRSKFLEGYFLKNVINGRIHADFKQMATEQGGARYGRMACANPPLQQVPKRSKYSKEIRTLFLPDEGEEWVKSDYSQQEYRLLVHYAETLGFVGAKEAGDYYRNDPNADFHTIVSNMTGLCRDDAKNVNFAKVYTAGVKKIAVMCKVTVQRAEEIIATYDQKAPYVKALSDECVAKATMRGWIRTIGGRVLHFGKWEPRYSDERMIGQFIEIAQKKWPGQVLRRSDARKGANRLIQGSAGDQTKIAMVYLYEEHGYVPLLQIHDELSFNGREKVENVRKGMEGVVKLTVPCKVDIGVGKNWGDAK